MKVETNELILQIFMSAMSVLLKIQFKVFFLLDRNYTLVCNSIWVHEKVRPVFSDIFCNLREEASEGREGDHKNVVDSV